MRVHLRVEITNSCTTGIVSAANGGATLFVAGTAVHQRRAANKKANDGAENWKSE